VTDSSTVKNGGAAGAIVIFSDTGRHHHLWRGCKRELASQRASCMKGGDEKSMVDRLNGIR
jgi:hypothetical protein